MKPLEGIRVIDLTTALSGPVATMNLGDMGADVVKVEAPEGDPIRNMGPMRNDGMGAMFLHVNRSKRSVVLNLKSDEGVAAMRTLLATADVFVCNTRTKPMARLGLAYEDIAKLNPKLIYVSITGYGTGGEWQDKPAYDDLIQGAAAIPSLASQAAPHHEARYAPIAIADRVTGLCAANAVLGALVHRGKTGEGQHIEVPMFETVASLVLQDHMQGATFVPAVGPTIFQRYAAIRRPFPTQDGHLCLMVLTDRQWKLFFETVRRPEVLDDTRFASMRNRTQHIDQLYQVVASILSERSTGVWMELLQGADLPCAQVESVDGLVQNRHLNQAGFFEVVEHPTEGKVRSMRGSSIWSRTQPGMTRPAPTLGQHTEEVLMQAGMDASAVQALKTNDGKEHA